MPPSLCMEIVLIFLIPSVLLLVSDMRKGTYLPISHIGAILLYGNLLNQALIHMIWEDSGTQQKTISPITIP